LGDLDLDECVSCGAGLLAVSDICPQCGWPKNNRIKPDEKKVENDIELDESEEKVENDIELDELQEELDALKKQNKEQLTKIKNKKSRPVGIRLISISYMAFGISLMLFGIIFASAVMFLVMSDAMGELGGIGGGMGNMPMLPGMGGMDASTRSSLGNIIDLNRIAGSPSASEIEMRMNSSGIMNLDVMMEIIEEIGVIAIIEIIIGLVIFGIGLVLFKGKKLARPAIIVSSIISIPLVASFVTIDTLVLLGMVAFNGVILYYMFKSKTREYFNQTPTKKSKTKTSPTVKVESSKVKQTVESESPQGKPITKFKSTQVRPLGITIIAILQILSGLFNLGVGLLSGTLASVFPDVIPGYTALLGFIGGGLIIHGVSQLVTAWGVLKGKSWAWKLTLILIIIGIILAAIREDVFAVIANVTWGVIFVYYLFRPHVKDYFGIIVKTTH